MPESDNRGPIESKAAPTKQFPKLWEQDLSEFVAAVSGVKDQPLLVKIADQSSYPEVARVAAVKGLKHQPSLAVMVDHICADQNNYPDVVRVAALGQLVANLTEESAKLIARFSQNIPKLVSEALLVKLIRENLIDRSRIAPELIRELIRRGGISRLFETAEGNPGQVRRLYEEICNCDSAAGCRHLADCYQSGDCTCVKDDRRAQELYQRACDLGDKVGCRVAVEIGWARARDRYREACERNDDLACAELAKPQRCYSDESCPEGLACLDGRCRSCFGDSISSSASSTGSTLITVVGTASLEGPFIDLSPSIKRAQVIIGRYPGDSYMRPEEVDRGLIDVYFHLREFPSPKCSLVINFATGRRTGLVDPERGVQGIQFLGNPLFVGNKHTFVCEPIHGQHRTLRVRSAR